jgi:hypothetical protein
MAEMDTPPLPNNVANALALRARDGLSFAETASLTGVPAGQLAAALYGLPARPHSPAFTELVVTGTHAPATAELLLRGPLGHELTIPSHLPSAQVAELLATLPC